MVLSVAHLDDEERTLVLGVVLEEIVSWVPTLRGSSALRAMVVFDEVYGFMRPQPGLPRLVQMLGSGAWVGFRPTGHAWWMDGVALTVPPFSP